MSKIVTAHGQTLRVFGKLMAGISLAVWLTGCGKTNSAQTGQMKTTTWSDKKVSKTKAKDISNWVNKSGKRTKVNVYTSIPDVAGVLATANMKSGYANRVYNYKSPAILDNYYFSYVPNTNASTAKTENKSIKHVSFKLANIDGVQISKDSGSFNNAVIYVSKDMIAKKKKLTSVLTKENPAEKTPKKSKKKSKDVDAYKQSKNIEAYTKNVEVYSKYRDGLYSKLLKALGLAASTHSYKMAVVK